MKKILFIFLITFFTLLPSIEGKNDKSSKGQEKKEWAQEKKEEKNKDMGRSEDAKKNWGQLKGEYDSPEEREEAKSLIQHKKRLRNILYTLDLDYAIDTEEEYNHFLELYYLGEFDLSEEEIEKIEEEILKFQGEYIEEEDSEVEDDEVEEIDIED